MVCIDGKMENQVSAAFVSSTSSAVAARDGLFVIDLETATVNHRISKDGHADVFYHDHSLYALNFTKKRVFVTTKLSSKYRATNTIDLSVETVHPSATLAMTSRLVNVSNYNNEVRQYSCDGALLQTVTINEHQPVGVDRFICAVDVDGRMALAVGGQLVIQYNNDSRVVKLESIKDFSDVVFEDQYTFWILDCISVEQGKYRIIKYNN